MAFVLSLRSGQPIIAALYISCPGRVLLREQQVLSKNIVLSKTVIYATSCRKNGKLYAPFGIFEDAFSSSDTNFAKADNQKHWKPAAWCITVCYQLLFIKSQTCFSGLLLNEEKNLSYEKGLFQYFPNKIDN